MHEHNVHHTKEFEDMKANLKALGREDLAASVDKVVKYYSDGNDALSEIIAKLK
jgi:hypothetical protein